MIEMSRGVIYGLFAFFIICGILLGLKRGLVKSVIRIITVLICCVLVVFIVPLLTSAILKADLSSTGLTIGDVPVTTINDTIINYIGSITGMAQLLATSPTLVAVINAVPAIIVNLILFILLFFVAKGLLYFVDIIINKIVIKKGSDKPKRRVWGAVVGGIQGLICFLFVLIPIAGSMNMLDETMDLIESTKQQTQVTAVTNISLDSQKTDEKKDGQTMSIEEFPKQATNAVDAYQDIFIIKMFNAIGYRAITNVVYDKLTTIEITEENKTTLKSEAKVVAKIYNSYEKLKDVDVAKFSEQNQKDTNQLIDDAFSSPVVGGITTELVTGVANAWTATNPSEFIGIAKPEFNENLVETVDVLLLNLRNNTTESLKSELKVIVGTIKVCADYNVTENVNAGDPDTLVSILGQEGCMEAVVGQLSTGKATKQAIPSLIEFGLAYGYEAVGIDNVEVHINKTADQVNWETEKVILGDLFEGVSSTYLSTKSEGELINKLDFIAMAKVLNSLRASQLLSDISQDVSVKLLSSNLTVGIDVSSLTSYISNDNTYRDMDFTVMLTTLKSSANIASDMKDIIDGTGDVTELNPEDVGTFLDGLTSNESTKDVLKDLANEENLKKAGADTETSSAVTGLIDAITGYDTTAAGAIQVPTETEELEKETVAVEKLLQASTEANDLATGYIFSDNEAEAKTKMVEFIDSITSSKFIYASTINEGVKLGFKLDDETFDGTTSNLSDHEKVWLIEVLREDQSKVSPKYTQLQCLEIARMFGLTYTAE